MRLSRVKRLRTAASASILFLLFSTVMAGPRSATARQPQQPPQEKGDAAPESAALPKGKKLILKDGSFQVVRRYEVRGDRVRFYSVERSAWEEVPAAMVDWDATHKAEADDARRQQESIEHLRADIKREMAASIDVDASIEVASAIFLPPGEGVFLLDGRAVLPLTQSEAQSKLDKKRLLAQVMVPVPVVPSRSTVFLPGEHAKFRINNPQPEFYMRTADAREPDMQLIRAKITGKARQLEFIDTYLVQKSVKTDAVPIQRWKVAKGVYRFTLGQTLQPGEYALAEIVPNKGMNLFLWDLGVDSKK